MNGKPLSPEVRATRTKKQVIQNIPKCSRTDWGGKEPKIAVDIKLKNLLGEACHRRLINSISGDDYQNLLGAQVSIAKEQVDGSRKRVSHTVEELLRRVEQDEL